MASANRQEFITVALKRVFALADCNIQNDITKDYERTILDYESLTIDEKTKAIKIITQGYDYNKFY